MTNGKRLCHVFHIGQNEIPIYYVYNEELEKEYPEYPDLKASPLYTAEGRPLTLAIYEGCPWQISLADNDKAKDCGGCIYFKQEETPFDLIGICMCEMCQHID